MPDRLRGLAVAAAGLACVATVTTQVPESGSSSRSVVSDISSPAIDRGIRENDPPREPRTIGNERVVARAAGRDLPYVPGGVIVKYRGRESFDIVPIDASADPEAVARDLSARADVEYAQARYRVHALFRPNDPLYSRQWNFPLIEMERAWDINQGASSAIVVAVLDSGVAFKNMMFRYTAAAFILRGVRFPALGPATVPFAAAPELGGPDRFVAPRDFIWDDTDPVDLDGHGTHVAGTIGQITNNGIGVAGMAFNVRLMPVKVIDSLWDDIFGSPNEATDDVVARGVRYAVDNGAKVLNMSIGRDGPPAPVVREAIQYAVSHGAFVAVAGGNEFEEGNPANVLAEFAPEIEGMVSVAAVGPDRTRAFYSNTGSYIELAAPGGNSRMGGSTATILQQTYDFNLTDTFDLGPARFTAPRFDVFEYVFTQGTSMAVPHVAGFAALLMQQGITRPAAIEAAMKRYATDLGAPGRDDEYGVGLINPRAALRGMGLVR